MSDIPTIKVKELPTFSEPCPRCKEGKVTGLGLDVVHCSNCGEFHYELEEDDK